MLDEAYSEFIAKDEQIPSFHLIKRYPNLIVCRTFSKAYGLAGLRIGYAVSNSEIADLLNRVRQPFNCNSLAITAATAALEDSDFLQKVVENNHIGLQFLSQFFEEKGLEYIPSKGNFILLNMGKPALPIYEKLLQKGVIVRPMVPYNLPNFLRITIGRPEENQRFVHALTEILAGE